MTQTELDQSLESEELEELDLFLAQWEHGPGLRLDGVHGLLTAAIVGPDLIMPNEWLEAIFGSDGQFASIEDVERILPLVMRLYNSIASSLEAMAFEPLLAEREYEDGEREVDTAGWCEGFSLGIDLRGDVWEQALARDSDLMHMMQPILALGADDGAFGEDGEDAMPTLSDGEREEMLQQIGSAVVDVMHYWRDHTADDASSGIFMSDEDDTETGDGLGPGPNDRVH